MEELKDFIKEIVIAIAISVFTYGLFSIIESDLNTANWDKGIRIGMVVSTAVCYVVNRLARLHKSCDWDD